MTLEPDNTVAGVQASLPSWRRSPDATSGSFEGAGHGADVSIFVVDFGDGEGPRLHHHPYSETFVLLAGRGRYHVDGHELEAAAGDVVVAPAGAASGLTTLGPERLRLVAIHAAPKIQATWVE